MEHKNDYSVLVYFPNDKKPKRWTYVDKLNGFGMFLNKSHPTWLYMNVYNRRTRDFMKQFKNGNFIPAYID